MLNLLRQNFLKCLDPILNPEACLPPQKSQAMAEENADALLKRLDLLLRQKVRFAMGGEKRSRIKGQGLDFSGLREYAPGDDIRKMDWSVFARTLSPYVREYQEEKQLTIWLVVDLTPSMHFGRSKTKAQQAIELAGLMGLLAQKAHHKLGGLIIQGQESRIISPKTGPAQVQHLMKILLEASANPGESPQLAEKTREPLQAACDKLLNLVQKQHTVIFLSDFLSQTDGWQSPLGELSRRAQLLCVMLTDPVESHLPSDLGLLNLADPETGAVLQIDTQDAQMLAEFAQTVQANQEEKLRLLRQMGIATLTLTETEPAEALLSLLTGQRAG